MPDMKTREFMVEFTHPHNGTQEMRKIVTAVNWRIAVKTFNEEVRPGTEIRRVWRSEAVGSVNVTRTNTIKPA